MKLIHKSSILEAMLFDAQQQPWPEGVTRVIRESTNEHTTSFEYRDPVKTRHKKYTGTQTLRQGDYIVSEIDEDSLEEIGRYVIHRELALNEYIVLGEVDTNERGN